MVFRSCSGRRDRQSHRRSLRPHASQGASPGGIDRHERWRDVPQRWRGCRSTRRDAAPDPKGQSGAPGAPTKYAANPQPSPADVLASEKLAASKSTDQPSSQSKTQITICGCGILPRRRIRSLTLARNNQARALSRGHAPLHMHRMMGGSYKTAWFMMRRIREAMREGKLPGGLGGAEQGCRGGRTYVGGGRDRRTRCLRRPPFFARRARRRGAHFQSAMSPRTPCARSSLSHVNRASYLMTDESTVYPTIGREFAGHGTVNHCGGGIRSRPLLATNTVEGCSAILKRGIVGVYHWVSEWLQSL